MPATHVSRRLVGAALLAAALASGCATLDAKQLVLWAFVLRQGFSLLKTAVSMLLIAATCELADES